MDYKESMKAITWHARFAKFGGTTFRVYMLLLTSANYKNGECRFSYDELVKQLGCAKSAATKAIRELSELGSIECKEKSMGRTPALYKIRSTDDLNNLHMVEQRNIKYEEWYSKRKSLFGAFDVELYDLEDEMTECDDCSDAQKRDRDHCEKHQYFYDQLQSSEAGRKLKVWLSDYPEPPTKVQTIFGRVL